jgi:hypothetical protein
VDTAGDNELVIAGGPFVFVYKFVDNQFTKFAELTLPWQVGSTTTMAIGEADNIYGNEIVVGTDSGIAFFSIT